MASHIRNRLEGKVRRDVRGADSLKSDGEPLQSSKYGQIPQNDYQNRSIQHCIVSHPTPGPVMALVLLVVVRLLGAFKNGIADCDETYNYWEPLHFLLYGRGFQTWEYSPEFAIRSYAFLYPFAFVAKAGSYSLGLLYAADPMTRKLAAFYSIRVVQAIICSFAEMSFYIGATLRFGPGVSRLLFIFLLSSPGMFRAATELLPSSFGMITFMFAASHWMRDRYRWSVFFVALGALMGWPFTALLGLPIALHVVIVLGPACLLQVAIASGIIILLVMVPVDTWHFGKLTIAPLNIVLYNVFPKEGAGPNIFGVEPLFFYIINLLLNLNVVFALACSCILLIPIQLLLCLVHQDRVPSLKLQLYRWVYLCPALLWLIVFCFQPHKEERFLVPIYPLLILVASVALSDWCLLLFHEKSESPSNMETARQHQTAQLLRTGLRLCAVAVAVVCGASRAYMQIQGFRAPFAVFRSLSVRELQDPTSSVQAVIKTLGQSGTINICISSEWHRFPSYFFVPEGPFKVAFVRSSFAGLLPKHFQETENGTRVVPPGMNMFNKEDPGQYILNPSGRCHYFVNLDLSHREASGSFGGFTSDASSIQNQFRRTVASEKLLDSENSKPGFRAFWIPGFSYRNSGYLAYGHFEVLRNLELVPDDRRHDEK